MIKKYINKSGSNLQTRWINELLIFCKHIGLLSPTLSNNYKGIFEFSRRELKLSIFIGNC